MERILNILALTICLLITPAASAAAKAGDVLLAQGSVFVRNAAGVERAATVGMAVESGETLVTRDGRLQVKFSDGGITSLQPESQFTITDYRFAGDAKTEESAVFKLIKGGFRTITGLVAKRDRSAYRVDTVVATIGVRGTEYQAVLCASSCKEPDGLYVHTGEGTIFVKNVAGEIDVGKGQSAFVASADTAPRQTTSTPPMTARVTTSAPPAVAGVGTTELATGNILGGTPQGAITPITGGGMALAASGTGSASVTSNFFNSASGTVSGAGSGSGATDAFPAGTVAGLYMNGGSVTGAVLTSSDGGVASLMFSAPPVNVGSNGDLYWGRWTGTTVTMYAGLGGYVANGSITLPATASLHYLLGTTSPTIPTTGMATFNFVGGTPSTDQAGNIGSGITGGSLTAYFNYNYVDGSFNVSHNGSYAVSAYMPMGSNRVNFGTDRGGSGYANYPAMMIPVKVNGFFVGSGAPTGAGVSYTINPNGANPIVGVGAFR